MRNPTPQGAPITLRRLLAAFAATAILALGGSALWRGWSRMWDTTVHPVREVGQITDAAGLVFPPGCQVLDGRFHKTGGLGPSGLWAVVRIPAAHLKEFL